MFTHDPDVASVCSDGLVLAGSYALLDAFQCVGQGVIRGAGKQSLGAVVAMACYYGITLPAAWLLAYKAGFGLHGLWYGMLTGNGVVAAVYVVVVVGVDWRAAARMAREMAVPGQGVDGDVDVVDAAAGGVA